MGKYGNARAALLALTAAAVFTAPLSWRYIYAPLLAACAAAVFVFLRGGRNWRTGPLKWPAAAFLSWSLLSGACSDFPAVSLFNWAALSAAYTALYVFILSTADTEKRRRLYFRTLLASAAVVVVYGAFQFANIQGMANELAAEAWVDPARFPLLYRRFYSTLENPNLCAGYLLMLAAVSGAAGLLETGRRKKWALLSFTGLLLLCLLLTYSRGAWVALAFMAAALAMLYDKRIWFVFLLVPPVLLLYHGQLTARFLSLFSGEDTSTLLRFALWDSTEAMIADHPLLGVGRGAYYLAYPAYNYFIQEADVTIYHAHNLYLTLAAETGIPGALLYLFVFFGHAALALRLYRHGASQEARAIGLATALSVIAMAVYGVGDDVLSGRAVSFVFWSLCALCAAEYMDDVRR